jgi:hypothetical protein
MTPYRISGRERPARDRIFGSRATSLRLLGALFAIAATASAVSLAIIGGNDVRSAVTIGALTDIGLATVVPLLVFVIGARAAPGTPLRKVAFATCGIWLALLSVRLPALADSYASAVVAAVLRIAGVAGLALLPFIAGPRRVFPRWPLFAIIALGAGDSVRKLDMARYHLLPAQFDPSPSTMALCILVAYALFTAARAIADESLDEQAERYSPPSDATLFASANARNAFLGPVRLATDVLLAFAVVTLVATTTTVAYSRSLRLDAPPAGAEASALVVLFTAAIVWLKRRSNDVSYAPVVGAMMASVAAIFSTMFANGAALSVALLPFGVAVIGLGVVAPRTRDATARTMRRWVTFVSATGVMLGSAGFFAIYSFSHGEPFLARIAKLAAVVFGVMAASAVSRIELHARIELAAEDREP